MTATVLTRVASQKAALVRLRGDDVDIPPALLGGGGVVSVITWLIWMLGTGRLVVGRVYDREVARGDKMEQIADQATKALQNISGGEQLAVALLKSVERKAAENTAQEGGDPS